MKKVGIDSLSYYVPSLYVDIEELASVRDIPSEKLVKGLGLKKWLHLIMMKTLLQ